MRIIVQARQGSTRLPGKIMALLNDRPVLWHVVRRLQRANPAWQVMVATTDQPADDRTADWCRENGIACVRGAADDVLARYRSACRDLHDDDVVLRATADNPLYCPRRTSALVAEHLGARADYTCIAGLSYVAPEAIRVGALREVAELARRAYCREHVTPYFREAKHGFRVVQLPATWCSLRPDLRLTIDTPQDYERMAAIFAACRGADPVFSLEQAYLACDAIAGSRSQAA
jgi:spore coat polysaccharide biosynthesis protein SpsF (cytidylyltransferase family)